MSTTLLNAEIELSKQLADYWASTTTSAGASGGTSIVDTALKAKENDWITDEAYTMITSGTNDEEERKISSLDNSTGTLTVLAHGAQVAGSVTYRVHRLFSASDKRIALIAAARRIYPHVYTDIWDETLVTGNWLKDGSFERWTSATNLTDWTETTVTVTQTSTSPYYKHGAYSAQLGTAAGTVVLAITDFDDLKFLAGKTVTFTSQGWCDTVSCLRLSVNDGTTQTYSSYHDGDSAWTQDNPRNDSFYVQQTISDNPTQITFTIHHENAAAASYVDDARVIGPYRNRLYIGHLGLVRNQPHEVYIEPNYYSQQEEWIRVRDYKIDPDGYLHIPTDYLSDRRLRIRGKKILDFLASGVSSTAWDSTIDIDQPELDVLVAEAALYLYSQMSLPNYESGTVQAFKDAEIKWRIAKAEAIAKYGMRGMGATIHYGVH